MTIDGSSADPGPGPAEGAEVTAETVLAAVRSVVSGAPLCFLATTGDDAPHLRLMQHFGVDDDLTVWFGTSRGTRKVRELTAHPAVTVGFQGADGASYAALTGTARVVDDVETRRSHWRPEWAAFFPGAPEGGDYVVLAVDVDRVEVVDFAAHVAPPPYGVAAAVLVRAPSGWVPGPSA